MDAYTTNEPIYALATPYAPSAIAIVRTSGDGVINLIANVFSRKEKLIKAKSNTLVHGCLVDQAGDSVDEVVLAVYREGHGYTGEEAIEINAHGSLTGLKRIFSLLESIGIKQAKKGEFTYRAFMHGRLDLTQAEAVEELISSKSVRGQASALERLEGGLKSRLLKIKSSLVEMLASLEVQLDYAEDEILEDWVMPREEINNIIKALEEMIRTYSAGTIYREGAKIVLAGSTNAGKSSLFNLLTKEDRAIVSPIAGTTRDYIEAYTTIMDIPVRLFDTAGLRDSDDVIESEGIKRSERLIDESDLVILLISPGEEEHITWKTKTIVVKSKNDLEKRDGLAISTLSGEGIGALIERIHEELLNGCDNSESGAISIDSERQRDLLVKLVEMLRFILSNENESVDIMALFFQSALSILGEITGEVTNEEILDTLFSKFCLGK
ncbi:tRNA uridine-5-carboxymethylaminomethyl(34) synthesis GTPase MnmE [Bullifex porci]|uniref:tRNA modification GTPase MnmE n=1 Tax=Bullifex porci TaxID=2606638 RepID=A0A7X2PDM9_9SPIO|nr:tRNA uridine-5-carboxymethylaminomethyl(34) synthesis GTPase MnmE [Bullifex porci]MDD7255879.1 tRNA uridine-5-carboxymethylaminomethyl(34) synthesis GTPase MnmE [Bullifex porci]MDY2742179.1 tRNA uridine-5-carboxymethylaminomethyl(34) synthesis GTPase MnmE [Bullifex porci]MSU06842.1 tRNA uridine-5-carboxymethylaminomethyl(34) synthesis GTPase MnmE [Bullifex porci]